MEDIRRLKNKKKLQRSIKISRFFNFFKKRWVKFLILILIILIVMFPNITGELFGFWWNEFASSFLEKITYIN